jgi:hypothetical protein
MVPDAARVPREILESDEAFKVVNGQVLDQTRFCHTDVDCHGVPSLLIRLQGAPVRHAGAGGAEVVLKVRATDIGSRWPSGGDLLTFVPVDPKSAPAPA